jgi:hypothetical protein
MARIRMAAASGKENWLVFIDTNILLDFYRLGGEAAGRQLAALDRHRGSIVTSDQIRMEFLKNRQKVIVESLGKLKKPDKMSVPPILTDYQPAKSLAKSLEASIKKYNEVKAKIDSVLNDPVHHDPVYRSLNKLFDHPGPANLRRGDKARFEVRNLARKRFGLGYPPRKAGDTSFGDALNWEWAVRCAQKIGGNPHLLIVSRDGDYGTTFGDKTILNDWLRREFKERVSRKRKVELTTKLTIALRRLDESVTPEDEAEEEKVIAETEGKRSALSLGPIGGGVHIGSPAAGRFRCLQCGVYDAWNGSRCTVCGFIDDD